MQLNQLSIIQHAKALAQIREQVQSILPAGVQLINIRGEVWVLGCEPILRTRIRFMVPELKEKLSTFAGKPVQIEVKNHIPEFPVRVVVEPPIGMSEQIRAKVLMDARMINDEKIRHKYEQLIHHVPCNP